VLSIQGRNSFKVPGWGFDCDRTMGGQKRPSFSDQKEAISKRSVSNGLHVCRLDHLDGESEDGPRRVRGKSLKGGHD